MEISPYHYNVPQCETCFLLFNIFKEEVIKKLIYVYLLKIR